MFLNFGFSGFANKFVHKVVLSFLKLILYIRQRESQRGAYHCVVLQFIYLCLSLTLWVLLVIHGEATHTSIRCHPRSVRVRSDRRACSSLTSYRRLCFDGVSCRSVHADRARRQHGRRKIHQASIPSQWFCGSGSRCACSHPHAGRGSSTPRWLWSSARTRRSRLRP